MQQQQDTVQPQEARKCLPCTDMLFDICSLILAVTVGRHVQEEFELMQSRFATMFSKVMEELTTAVELDLIKRHLRFSYRDLKAELASAQTVEALIEVIRDNCSFTNYSILTALARHFKNQTALNEIEAYTEERNKYYRRVLAEDFAKVAMRQAKSIPNGHITVNHCFIQLLMFKYVHNCTFFRSHLLSAGLEGKQHYGTLSP